MSVLCSPYFIANRENISEFGNTRLIDAFEILFSTNSVSFIYTARPLKNPRI